MKKKRAGRLACVAQIAKTEERNAATELAAFRKVYEQHRKKFDELNSYRTQYISSFRQAADEGVNAGCILNYRRFLSNLDGVIEQQSRLLNACSHQLQQYEQTWRERRIHHKVIDDVHEKALDEEQRHKWKAYQKESDDLAQIMYQQKLDH